jgi:hypothetical protein
MKRKRSIITLILILGAVFCAYGQNSDTIDLVLLLDTSSSMGSSSEKVNDYITGKFLSEFLRVGDTFHLISFSSGPRLDIARKISARGDIETIIGRMLIQYPVETGNNVTAAVNYAEAYIATLPPRPKKIVVVSAAGPETSGIINSAKQRFSSKNATFDFVSVTEAIPGSPNLSNPPGSGRSSPRQTSSQQTAQSGTASNTGTGSTKPAGTASTQGTSGTQAGTSTQGTSSQGASQTGAQTSTQSGTGQGTSQTGTQGGTAQGTSQTGTQSGTQGGTTQGTTGTSRTGGQTSTQGAGTQSTTNAQTTPSTSDTAGTGSSAQGVSSSDNNQASDTTQDTQKQDSAANVSSGSQSAGTSGQKKSSSIHPTVLLIIGIIAAILLLILLIFFISRRLGSSPNRVMASVSSGGKEEKFTDHSKYLANYAAGQSKQRVTPYQDRPVKQQAGAQNTINPSGPLLLNLFVDDQSTSIGKRNIHSLKSGYSLSVGGGASDDFHIFLVQMPPHLGDIRRNGSQLTFIPRKPKYFPDIGSNEVKDCINKRIRVVSDKNYEMWFSFVTYEDPLEALNRVLHSIKVPG